MTKSSARKHSLRATSHSDALRENKCGVRLHAPSYSSSTVNYLQHLSREWTHMLCTVWYHLSRIKAKHSRHFPNKRKTQRIISWGQTEQLIHLELLVTPAELGHGSKVAGVTTSEEQVQGSKHLWCGPHSLQRLGVVLARTTVAAVVIYMCVWGGRGLLEVRHLRFSPPTHLHPEVKTPDRLHSRRILHPN